MADKTRLPWWRQCWCIRHDDLKMFPDNFYERLLSLAVIANTVLKLFNILDQGPSKTPPCLNRVIIIEKEYLDRQQSKSLPYRCSVQFFFISSVWYWVSTVYQCPRIRGRQMQRWQSSQSYLPRWIESVYELERKMTVLGFTQNIELKNCSNNVLCDTASD